MPVLSENHSSTVSGVSNTYIFLGIAILLILGISISRRRNQSALKLSTARIPSALPEKSYLPNTTSKSMQHQEKESHSAPPQSQAGAKPRIPRPPQQPPPPFKPLTPGLSTSLIQPEPPSPTLSMSPIGNSPTQLNFVPSPTEYTSFEAMYGGMGGGGGAGSPQPRDISSFSLFEGSPEFPPRRRSYTKSLSNGSEVSGEIVVSSGAEGQQWRRHTRVFGGGVCKACEESERRMSA